ncbi:stage II sporulation protein R [Caminicella sporogenes DSM 14501]|uniref:Stage II sporulation protein R n=1 Tax=Caminicella sporogenes DSM 14501 TaxID=1121266 RepID=A0A1M6PP23_9FIRM|nr:stage II sporulation protein R [Caminicella sporogenes]SHK09670.1 stage II sporulation protein R [Caminicella sporogenes DSM 14501]
MMYKKKNVIGFILLGLIIFTIFFNIFDVYKNRESYKQDLIRFHVIANSDSPIDQALKLKVRDRVLKEMDSRLNTRDINKAKEIIRENIKEIEEIALDEIKKNGFDYSVRAALEKSNFPTKIYGSIALPAGTYEALRIVIGKGEGKNWWCVLFPPLCFIDVKSGLTNEKTKEELRQVLTKEEFDMINAAASKEGQLPIKLKFKIVEILENSKWKIKRLVGYKN